MELTKKKLAILVGYSLVALAAICNEVVLTHFFSPDGYLAHANILRLRIFQAVMGIFGLVLVVLPADRQYKGENHRLSRMLYAVLTVLFVLNLAGILVFFLLRWFPLFSQHAEIYGAAIYLFVMCAAYLLCLKKEQIVPGILLWNFCQFLLIVILLLVELLFSAFPRWVPSALKRYNPSLNQQIDQNANVVEYLEESPWVKFAPDKVIKIQGQRGPDFTYQWKTDGLGFKNSADVASRQNIFAVALGDSFVEGMGVPVEQTWPSILSREGFRTYNLGVQGYAPIQMVGSLRKWGAGIHPEFVILGYTPGFEDREAHFLNLKYALKYRVFTGGIQQINDYMSEKRSNGKAFPIINTVFDIVLDSASKLGQRKKEETDSIFSIYADEVHQAQSKVFDPNKPEYRLTKKAILEAKRISDSIGARMLVVIFSHRRLVYAEQVLGREPPADHYELQLVENVKNFSEQNGIDVISLYEPFEDYMELVAAQDNVTYEDLPYFKMDGHLNAVGHQIVADALIEYFKRKKTESSR